MRDGKMSDEERAAYELGVRIGEERGRNFSYKTMDIYSKPGTKVRFMGLNGGDHHLEWAREKLVQYHVYTLKFCVVDSSSTDVYLEETGDLAFNSVMFEVASRRAVDAIEEVVARRVRAEREALVALVDKWADPEFWKDDGCRMDSSDCAKELQAAMSHRRSRTKIL